MINRRLYWWGGVVNLLWHVTAFNQSDCSIGQSNCRTVVTCQNKFTTPPYQYGRLWCNWILVINKWSRVISNVIHKIFLLSPDALFLICRCSSICFSRIKAWWADLILSFYNALNIPSAQIEQLIGFLLLLMGDEFLGNTGYLPLFLNILFSSPAFCHWLKKSKRWLKIEKKGVCEVGTIWKINY